MAAPIAIESDPGGNTFWGRTANRIVLFVICVPVSFAMISLFAGCGLAAYKTYLYLRHGQWLVFQVGDIVRLLDLPLKFTGWIGFDQIMLDVMTWSGLTSLLLWIPLACLLLLALSLLGLSWLSKRVW